MLLDATVVDGTGFAGRGVEDLTICGITALAHGTVTAAFLAVCPAAAEPKDFPLSFAAEAF